MIQIYGHMDVRKYDDYRWSVLRRRRLVTPDNRTIEVRPGFVLDFGSIPRSLRGIVQPMGSEADEGFFWHDSVYASNRYSPSTVIVSEPFTRKEADDLMMAIHLQSGVEQELAEAMWLAVRLGASQSWSKS